MSLVPVRCPACNRAHAAALFDLKQGRWVKCPACGFRALSRELLAAAEFNGGNGMPNEAPQDLPKDAVPDGCVLKDDAVIFAGMHPKILAFLAEFGPWYQSFTGKLCVITSARDGLHAESGGHPKGMAVDIRSWGIDALHQIRVAARILELSDAYHLRLYDESRLPSAGHFHVDTVG